MRHFTAIMIAGWAMVGVADDLSNNLEQQTAGTEEATPSRFMAARFFTDASEHDLTAVTIRLAASLDADATLRVHLDGGLEPGDLVGTMTSPSAYPSLLDASTFTSSGIALEPSTSYWVVLAPTSGSFDWAWTEQNSGDGTGFSTEWGSSDLDQSFWWTQDVYPLQVRVTVDEAVTCLADYNGDGDVDVFDVFAYLEDFDAEVSEADLTEDGVFDIYDVLVFLGAFSEGCP